MKHIILVFVLALSGCHTYVYVQGEGNTTVVNDERSLGGGDAGQVQQ